MWWTCGCGKANCSRGPGTPVCEGCGKLAKFAVQPPKEQAGFDFGGESPPRPTGYEE